MRPFGYERATTLADAVAVATSGGEVSYLAGGTNLVDLMRLGVARPERLVDVKAVLPSTIDETADGGLLIGAGVLNSELAADQRIRRDYPVLSQALLAGASGQLRNMATTGGNLLQRTRCLYFMDATKPCNKHAPGSGCPARAGIHRDLAILGASEHCIATHPSDMAVALAALDARVHVTGSDGQRVVELDDFYRLPGDEPTRDTTLQPGDLITGVELPAASSLSRTSTYRKARDRASYAFAVGAVAAALELADDGTVSDVRIALGAVAHKPWRAQTAEDALHGQPLSDSTVRAAMDAELAGARPLPDNAFKVLLATNLTCEALGRLAGAAEEKS